MKKLAVMEQPATAVGVERTGAGTGRRIGTREGTVKLEPQRDRLGPKPGWRERRQLRTTAKYQTIREHLGTSDAQTLLLLRVGDLQATETGQSVTAQPWSRSHVVIGLTARLAVGVHTEVSAPWLVDHRSADPEMLIAEPGLVLFIHRRHLHLVEPSLSGRVEPVAPIARAVDRVSAAVAGNEGSTTEGAGRHLERAGR